LIRSLAERAIRGSEEFTVRPFLPLYLPGESIQLDIVWHTNGPSTQPLTVKIVTFPEAQPSNRSVTTAPVPLSQPLVLPAPNMKGLHIIEAALTGGQQGPRPLSLRLLDSG